MEELEQEEGISLLDIIKVMFSRKILLLIITVAVGIVGTLVILLGYNRLKSTYVSSFTYSNYSLNQDTYIDGATFNYASLITEDNLKKVKESNESFSSINVTDIIDNNDISITRVKEETSTTPSYTIKVEGKYFSNSSQAKEFIKAVVSLPLTINTDKLKYLAYDDNLVAYNNAAALDSKITYLKQQYNFILSEYESLTTMYNNYIISSTNKSIASYKTEFESAFNLTNSVDALYSNLLDNVYVLDYDNKKDLYEIAYSTCLSLYNSYDKKIEDLKSAFVDIISAIPDSKKDSVDLSKYYNEIINATSLKRKYYELYIYYANVLEKLETTNPNYIERASEAESQAFLKNVDATKELLVTHTNILKNIKTEVLTDNNSAYYISSNVVATTGNIKPYIAIIASLAVGLVAGCIVNLILDHKKIGKKEQIKEPEKTTE